MKAVPYAIASIEEALAATSLAFVVGLDRTGVREQPLPPSLQRTEWDWRTSEHWSPSVATPLDAVDPTDHETVVGTFLAALESGFGNCRVRLQTGPSYSLSFWNCLHSDEVVVVVAEPTDTMPMGTPSAASPEPLPLRLVQTSTVHGLIDSIDDATRLVLGWDDDVIGQPRLDFQDSGSTQRSIRMWSEVLAYPSRSFRDRIQLRGANGEWRWFDTTTRNHIATKGVVLIEHIDITEHVRDAENIDPMFPLADYLAGLAGEAMICVDDTGTVLARNARFTQLTGINIDPQTRRILPAPQFIAEPFKRIMRAALAANDLDPHEAYISHGDFRLRLCALSVPLSIDRRACTIEASDRLDGRETGHLPKGLSPGTLERVVGALASLDEPARVQELADLCGLSSVSIRRYLSFLIQTGSVTVHRSYGQRGRPTQTYSLAAENRLGF